MACQSQSMDASIIHQICERERATHPAEACGMTLPLPNAGGRGVGCQILLRKLSGLRAG